MIVKKFFRTPVTPSPKLKITSTSLYHSQLSAATNILLCFFFQNYFRDFWNVFDFIIVITTLVGVILELNVSNLFVRLFACSLVRLSVTD